MNRTFSRYRVLIATGLALLITWTLSSIGWFGGQYLESKEVFNDLFRRLPEGYEEHVVDVKDEMRKLNEEKVAQDDPRLIKIIKDHYLLSPSAEPYNLNEPHKKEHTGQGKDFLVPNTVKDLPEVGFFIECGARDGELLSSTLYFEREKNWTGLLIEANPMFFEELRQKHRKSWLLNACLNIYPYPSIMKFNQLGDLSRIVESTHKEAYAHHFGINQKPNITEVQCFPLFSVLQALGGPRVDYMSLDVEGSELDILTTVPWDKVDIDAMIVEFSHEAGKLPPLKHFLEDKGYETLKVLSEDILVQKKK